MQKKKKKRFIRSCGLRISQKQHQSAAYEVKAMNTIRKDVKNVPVGTVLEHLESTSESNIPHNIECKPTGPGDDVERLAPPIATRSTLLRISRLTVAYAIAKSPHMLQDVILHRFDHFPRQCLR